MDIYRMGIMKAHWGDPPDPAPTDIGTLDLDGEWGPTVGPTEEGE